MSNYSDIAIAIGGKPSVINPFMEAAKTANLDYLDSFQCCEVAEDLTVFAYALIEDWENKYKKTAWQETCQLANKFKLSWVLYWVTDGFHISKQQSNSNAAYFDKRMLQLFELKLQPIVNVQHPRLRQKLERFF